MRSSRWHDTGVTHPRQILPQSLRSLEARIPMIVPADPHQEIRDAVRQLCRQFPDAYFRKLDEEKAYPDAFVDVLMAAGWLAAMIPQEYGGAGLGLTEASVVL